MQLLALHGFTGVGEDFDPLINRRKDLDWHCPDLLGHGSNQRSDCSVDATAKWVELQRSALRRGPRLLLGYSMGARAALIHATRYPNEWDGLILISANPGIESDEARTLRLKSDEQLAQTIDNKGVKAFLDDWQKKPIIQSQQMIPEQWRIHMHTNRLKHTALGLATSLREFGQGVCPNLWPELINLKMPVLCLTGEHDLKYQAIAERLSVEVPTLKNVTVPNAGHMPHLEQFEHSMAAIERFIETF